MAEDFTPEEILCLDLLDSNEAEPGGAMAAGDAGDASLRREYLEILGLLPGELAEATPRAEVKGRILHAIGHGARPVRTEEARRHSATRAQSRWLPVAASVGFAVLAFSLGALFVQVQNQRVRIAELSNELVNAQALTAALAASQSRLAETRAHLAMATSQGAEFCPLNPPEGSPAQAARGVVVMQAGRDEWFLRIEGLAPCPRDRKYALWFATERGAVAGPTFAVKAGETVELTIMDQPEKVEAIMITLESEPAPLEPSMEPLLFGDERMQLL